MIFCFKIEEFLLFLTCCFKFTTNHESKFGSTCKMFFPNTCKTVLCSGNQFPVKIHIYFYFLTLSLSSWNCPVGLWLGLGLTIPKTSTLSINRNPYNSLFEESCWLNSLAEKKIRALHRSGRRRSLSDNLIKGRTVYSAGCMESAVGVVIPRKSPSKKYP